MQQTLRPSPYLPRSAKRGNHTHAAHGLLRGLEGQAEALAGTFNVQRVANTLRVYATMGRAPGADLMRELVAGTARKYVARLCLPARSLPVLSDERMKASRKAHHLPALLSRALLPACGFSLGSSTRLASV